MRLISCLASISFEELEKAFGPSSLGILIVKDLPPQYMKLRHQLLSFGSYLANLSSEELGKSGFSFLLLPIHPLDFFFFLRVSNSLLSRASLLPLVQISNRLVSRQGDT